MTTIHNGAIPAATLTTARDAAAKIITDTTAHLATATATGDQQKIDILSARLLKLKAEFANTYGGEVVASEQPAEPPA